MSVLKDAHKLVKFTLECGAYITCEISPRHEQQKQTQQNDAIDSQKVKWKMTSSIMLKIEINPSNLKLKWPAQKRAKCT